MFLCNRFSKKKITQVYFRFKPDNADATSAKWTWTQRHSSADEFAYLVKTEGEDLFCISEGDL